MILSQIVLFKVLVSFLTRTWFLDLLENMPSKDQPVPRPEKRTKLDFTEDNVPPTCRSPHFEHPHVVKLVAESGFPTTEELGRLTLCTSKQITMAICERNNLDDVFKCVGLGSSTEAPQLDEYAI